MTLTTIVRLPRRFYEDFADRSATPGTPVRTLARQVDVVLDREAFDELLDDARWYALGSKAGLYMADEGVKGLCASARATVKRLEAADRPDARDRTPRLNGRAIRVIRFDPDPSAGAWVCFEDDPDESAFPRHADIENRPYRIAGEER